ncbi:MAG TPA: acyl carrier protein [Vicinamibacterales bacterium]|nr:acyl carrier protein [Vicinamibacterales bacterium]
MNEVKDDVKDVIQRFIWTNYIEGKFSIPLDGSTRLRSSGLMDSLATVGMISFIEKEFDIEFSALELTVDNLDTIDQIASLIARKRK